MLIPDHDPDLAATERRLDYFLIAFGLLGALVAGVTRGRGAAGGILLGSGLSYVNFRWLKAGVTSLTSSAAHAATTGEGAPPKVGLGRFLFRFALVGIALYAILISHLVAFWAVLVGLFAAVAAILLEAVYEAARAVWSRP